MPEKINLAEVLAENPHVDPQQLNESMELLEKLRGCGVQGRGYELVPPFGGRRVQVVDTLTEDNDPRTIHLNRV